MSFINKVYKLDTQEYLIHNVATTGNDIGVELTSTDIKITIIMCMIIIWKNVCLIR